MTTAETEFKTLMLASQEGDAASHRLLLERLSRHLLAGAILGPRLLRW